MTRFDDGEATLLRRCRLWWVVLGLSIAIAACAGDSGSSGSAGGGGAGSEKAAGRFDPTGKMVQGRQVHTATLLQDGRVLAAGGRSPAEGGWTKFPTIYKSAEIYDPASGAWSPAGTMAEERAFHTSSLLEDGRVLIVGNRGKNTVPEIYDPSTGRWSESGEMVKSRAEHTATVLQDGRVLVTGGLNFTLAHMDSAELYDVAADTWTSTGPMADERANHTATLLSDGRVLVVGSDVSLKGLPSAEVYDPATGAWTEAATMSEGRAFHTATTLEDGRVLVVGGQKTATAEIWDPATGTWSSAGAAEEPREGHTATLLGNGLVLVAGGSFDLFLATALGRSSTEIYDPSTNTWGAAGVMAEPRLRFTATTLKDGRVLLAGGQHKEEVTDSVELFSP